MSSILDALKKLEQDKQEKEQSDQLEIGTLAAERDLFHRKRGAGRGTIQVSSMVLVGGVLVFAVALVCVSVITALLIVNAAPVPPATTTQVAQTSPTNTAAPSVIQDAPVTPVPAEPVSLAPVSDAPMVVGMESAPPVADAAGPAPAPPVDAPQMERPTADPEEETLMAAAQAPAVAKPDPVEEPAPRVQREKPPTPRPEPESVVQTTAPAPAKPERPAADKPDPAFGDLDLNVLPILSESERVRLGLPPMQVNIVGLPTKRQPRPSALINYEKVYLGEYISNTNARLVDVELRGVGLSVGGQLYFLPK